MEEEAEEDGEEEEEGRQAMRLKQPVLHKRMLIDERGTVCVGVLGC